jgi:prephenate dehydrogenase
MKIGVIGVGLIGGSFALGLKERGHEILGMDAQPLNAQKAVELGIISHSCNLAELAETCDVIILSIPVNAAAIVLSELLDLIPWRTTVMDTGSTKSSLCKAVIDHPKRGRFVACHPLSGTEFSGPGAALPDLFKGKKNIICEEHRCDEDALDMVIHLLQSLDMHNIFMNPDEHDLHMAYVSHLSHVSSFMLGSTVLDIEKDEKQIFNLASTGFASTVRLAKSSPETWSAIFSDNSQNITQALEAYIAHLQQMKNAIEEKNNEKLKALLEDSNEIRRVLNGMKYNIVKLS